MSSGEVGLHEEEEEENVAYFGFESQRKESFGFESQRREKKNDEGKMATSEATMNSLEKRGNYVLENVNEQDTMMATNEISLEETMCLEHYEKENEQVIQMPQKARTTSKALTRKSGTTTSSRRTR